MTEIQRLLTETIESLNTREKRDNKPRFSISFIRKHPGLFIGMYVAFATTAVMLQSKRFQALSGYWLYYLSCLMVSSFSMSTHATAMKISTCWISAFAITANGTTRALYLPRWLKPS